jgi:hypothetical protein
MKGRIILAVLILVLGPGGCGPHRRPFVMPNAPLQAAAKPLPEVTIVAPPEIETPVPIVEIPGPRLSAAEDPSTVKAPQDKRPQQAHVPGGQATPPETEPVIPPPVAPTAPAPRLGEILTDSRRREYEADFNRYMDGARAALKRASPLRLSDSQRLTMTRIKTFLEQAETSRRARDLATALQLARRADLLGQDLLKSLR